MLLSSTFSIIKQEKPAKAVTDLVEALYSDEFSDLSKFIEEFRQVFAKRITFPDYIYDG